MPGIECFKANFDVSPTLSKTVTAADQAISVDMCMTARVDLDSLTTLVNPTGTATYSVTSNNGDGDAIIEDGELRYCSSIETGPVQIEYEANCDGQTDTGIITVNLTNQFTLADAKTGFFNEVPALHEKITDWEASTLYDGSYTNLAYRNLFSCTCDIDYWNSWKTYFNLVKSEAVESYEVVTSPNFYNGNNISSPIFTVVSSTTTSAVIAGDQTGIFQNNDRAFLYDAGGVFDWASAITSSSFDGTNTTISWVPVPSLITVPPMQVAVGNLYSGPYNSFGANGTYVNFPKYNSGSSYIVPTWKNQNQWSMTALHLLHDIICGDCGLPQAEVDEAIAAYDWIHKNIIEFWITERFAGWASTEWLRALISARDEVEIPTPNQTGYWGSDIGLGITCLMLIEAIRTKLGRPRELYMDWIDNLKNTSTDPIWTGFNYDPFEWYTWWRDQVVIFPDGTGLWDCGDDPSDPAYNAAINSGNNGWGYPGEHKCPSTNHASRYIYLAQVALDTGFETDKTVMEAISKTFACLMCLPIDYEYTDGTFAGQSSGTQRIANYIDGDNTCFRCPEAGFYSAHGTNEDMNSQTYQGWYLAAACNDDAKDCVVRLHQQVNMGINTPSAPSDIRWTGTYQRNSSLYGRAALWSDMIDIKHRRGQI